MDREEGSDGGVLAVSEKASQVDLPRSSAPTLFDVQSGRGVQLGDLAEDEARPLKGGKMKTVTFEQYLDRMGEPVKRAAWKRSHAHPYLGEDDLFQEALLALWTVWNKHRRKLPFEDLCKVGWRAAMRKMITQKDRANSRGERPSKHMDLIGPPMIESLVFKDGRHTNRGNLSNNDHEKVFIEFTLRAINKTLSDVGRSLLGEILQPGEETLRAVKELWTNRGYKHAPFWRIEPKIYAKSLGVPTEVIKGGLAEIRWKFEMYFKDAGLPIVGKGKTIKEEEKMDREKDFVTDPLDFEAADPEEPVEGSQENTVVDLDDGDPELSEVEEGFGGGEPEPEPEAKEEKPEEKATTPKKTPAPKKTVATQKVKPKPKAKPEAKAKPKAKSKAKIVKRVAVKGDQFRAGTKRAKVWAILVKKLDAGKTLKAVHFAKAFEKVGRLPEGAGRSSGSLFAWNLLNLGLIKRSGRGEFVRAKR